MSCQLDISRKGVAKAGVEVDQAGLVGADGKLGAGFTLFPAHFFEHLQNLRAQALTSERG